MLESRTKPSLLKCSELKCAKGSLGGVFQQDAYQVRGVNLPGVKPVSQNSDLKWQLTLTYISGLGPGCDLML